MKKASIKLAPSILAADFSCLREQVVEVTQAGADYIHIDVMDGHFVPNITVGPQMVAVLRSWSSLPFDVHLMLSKPQDYVTQFAKAGANIITVHVEACVHLHRLAQQIRELGAKVGVALNPGTSLVQVEEILPFVDMVLVMTVNPGFSGQAFIPQMLGKIQRLRKEIDERKLNVELEVDGGISADVARAVVDAGASVLVAGAAIFNNKHKPSEAVRQIRMALPRQ